MYLPDFMYRQLPWVYVCVGGTTLFYLPSPPGITSGLILICAGSLVLLWRGKAARRGHGRKARERRLRTEMRRESDDPYERDSTGESEASRTESGVAAPTVTIITEEATTGRKRMYRSHGTHGERRVVPDRRSWKPMAETPFIDSEGVVVIRDRRQSPDRRIGSIQVREFAVIQA